MLGQFLRPFEVTISLVVTQPCTDEPLPVTLFNTLAPIAFLRAVFPADTSRLTYVL